MMTEDRNADSQLQDRAVIGDVAREVRDALVPGVLYLFREVADRGKQGEAVTGVLVGTMYAAMEIVARLEFPTTKDADAMRKHLHDTLDLAFNCALVATVAGRG